MKPFFELVQNSIWKYDPDEIQAQKPWLRGLKLSAADRLVEAFEQDQVAERWHSYLFEGTHADVQVPLWESWYRGGRHVLLDETTLAVTREYYAQGLQPEPNGQPADYIGFEIEFLLILLHRGCVTEAQNFWEQHLSTLLKDVFVTVKAYSCGAYYTALADFVLEYISDLSDLTGEKGGTEKTYHFLPVSEKETAEALAEREVRTAGRGNCGGKCVIRAFTAAGCITHLESDDDEEHACSLKACVRGRGYRKTFLNEGRLRYPMVRVGERGEGTFRRISWDEALDLMEEKLKTITEKYGPGSRYINYGSGISSTVRGDQMMGRLLAVTGGYLDRYNSYSSACSGIAVPYTYGTRDTGASWLTYKEAEMVILWGDNPVVTQYISPVFELFKYLKEKGTPIVVIDPQFSDTMAVFGTQWIPIRPGTDSALASAMAYVLWEEGLCDKDFMDRFCIGFDREHMPADCKDHETYYDYIYGVRDGVAKTPEWAAEITGVDAEVIRDLAIRYGKAKPAAIIPGLGMQRHANGEQSVRSVAVLPCMTGNVGVAGGGTGARGFAKQHVGPSMAPIKNPYGASIPCFLWTDAVTRGAQMTAKEDHVRGREQLDSNVKLIFNLAGNALVNQHSDINRTIEILKDTSLCEFIVVSDLFMTSSARYADLLLPATSLFESDSLTTPWEEGNYLLYGNQAIRPLFESRFEFDWIKELSRRMGTEDISEGCETLRDYLQHIYERLQETESELPPFEEFAKKGGYKYRNNKLYIPFKEQIENLEKNPFPTPSGKIEIFSKALLTFENEEEIPPIPKYVPAFEGVGDPKQTQYPLQLIGWHTKRRCHSIHDNNEWMEAVEPHRVWLHPQDAAARGVEEGMLVQVYNDRGIVEIPVHVSSRIMPGVVCIPQGAWYRPDSRGVDVRGCINVLSTLRPTPLAKGNPQHSNLVDIRPAER